MGMGGEGGEGEEVMQVLMDKQKFARNNQRHLKIKTED